MEQKNNSAKFSFYYLLSLVGLLFMSISVGIILFQIINKYIFDPLDLYSGNFMQEGLKFAISALLISTPIFYVVMREIYKNLASGVLEKDSPVRRWLTYFVLLVSAVVMIFWLITTINSYLNGELSLKASLKTLTVLGIAAMIFSFYLLDIRRGEVTNKSKLVQAYFYSSLAIVAGVFVWSLFVVESPRETRNRRLDEAIVNNFASIDGGLNSYYSKYDRLPDNIDVLTKEDFYLNSNTIQDPTTKKVYEYKKKGDKEYEICANFRTSNKNSENKNDYNKDRWPHDAGYQCISQKITYVKGINPEAVK